MPKHLSAVPEILIQLAVIFLMILFFAHYNRYLAAIALVVLTMLAIFSWERYKHRREKFREYFENVVGSGNELIRYAVTNIPQAIMVVNQQGRLEWFNELTTQYSEYEPEQGALVDDFWNGILHEEVLEPIPEGSAETIKSGKYVAKNTHKAVTDDGEVVEITRYFLVRYRQMINKGDYPTLIVLFAQEITVYENLKQNYKNSRTVLMYVQIDNYDELMQGLNEAEKTSLLLAVSEELEKWMAELQGFIQRVSNDLFIVVLEQLALQKAVEEKFTVLDKVRQIVSKNGIPATLSIGAAVADKNPDSQSLTELGKQAQERLNAALARGGDQVAINLDGKAQYFGGRAKAVEKHNRVRARVMANSIREHMESADEIFVMGHVREDFDAFGAAMGIAVMAMHLKRPVHVVLSNSVDSIEKILDQFNKDKSGAYKNFFVKGSDLSVPSSINPLLFVVDTHIPYLTAAPNLLERIQDVIVIDHHRKSDNVIQNPIVFYHEPSSSSACELVTELLMYFDEKISIGKLAATALYSGIVVDTKSFVVQTGIRTFDAAAYLRRNGADPVVVRELFMSDYETTVALAKAKAQSEYFEGGLVVATMPTLMTNIQAVAGQAADSLLTIENVRMTIVLFQMKNDTIGISARSNGTFNVQVIMEQFGGGGHQNVAGAQVKNTNIIDLKNQVVAVARKFIAENDKEDD
mgnify:CR=1 FL=1